MKKIILFLMLFLTSSFGSSIVKQNEYKIFTSYTKEIDLSNISEKKEIYFGDKSNFSIEQSLDKKTISNLALNGTIEGLSNGANSFANSFFKEGLKSGVAGLGIGLIFGSIEAYRKSEENKKYDEKVASYENKTYYLVEDIITKEGDKTRKFSMFVLALKYKLDKNQIKNILKGK